MPNERSIPKALEDTIVRKWITGKSPEAIADWVIESNRRRRIPVHTSRSSIERLLAEQMARDHTIPRLRVTLEVCRDAATHYARLREIHTEYTRLLAEEPSCETEEDRRRDRAQVSRRLRVLAQEERYLTRTLRLAGVGGVAGQQLLESKDVEHLQEDEEDAAAVERALVAELEKAAAAFSALGASDAGKSVRLDDGSPGETSESESPVASASPSLRPLPAEVPRIADPDWNLTPEQREEWEHTKAIVQLFLLATWGYNGNEAPKAKSLAGPLPPVPQDRSALRIAELVPALTLPDWPMTKEHARQLETQMKRVNAWIQWFREQLHRDFAGQGNWRKDWCDGYGRQHLPFFNEG